MSELVLSACLSCSGMCGCRKSFSYYIYVLSCYSRNPSVIGLMGVYWVCAGVYWVFTVCLLYASLSAGVGRTGIFIALSIVLERMRLEGVVDLFQTVKLLRTQRPAMVQTEVRNAAEKGGLFEVSIY